MNKIIYLYLLNAYIEVNSILHLVIAIGKLEEISFERLTEEYGSKDAS